MSPPRIITFYSYKGGTGRSMALANIAWILASNEKHVLVIDWDLEAPGLHRYLHPYLRDKELTSTDGLIDFVIEYASRAVTKGGRAKSNWYEPYTNILRYATSLNYPFKKGTIDFVPAGRQGTDYATRVNSFNWQHFYERLDGGMFFEAAKESMADYDYVLIDSRTGVSDTSGICTVQMPDLLVVCFTLNIQSIEGAAAVAESADMQRRDLSGKQTLKIFPIPTRVELTETGKLNSAREVARERFNPMLNHLGDKRAEYWNAIEVLYQPFYAYEEILSVFGDAPGKTTNSMLSSMETLAGYLTENNGPLRMPVLSQADRDAELVKYSRETRTIVPNLVHRLQGHSGSVRAVSLNAENNLVLSGSEDTTVKLWDLTSGEVLLTLTGHTDAVQTVTFAPDVRSAISGSNDSSIIVWNLNPKKVVKTLAGHSAPVHSVVVSANGKFILSGSADKTVVLWDFKTGKKLKTLKAHEGAVAAVAISADGSVAASGSFDKIIVVWDLTSGKALRTFSGHTREVTSLSMSPDGKRLLSGSADQSVRFWDIQSGQLIRNMKKHSGRVYAVDMSADGRYAVSGSADKSVILWNLETGEMLRTFEGHSSTVNAVKLSTDSRSAVSASDDGSLIVWDLSAAVTEVKKEVVKAEPVTKSPRVRESKKPSAPVFYVSFARSDADKYFQKFISDLSMELSFLQAQQVSLFHDLSVGEDWAKTVGNAVRTCKVAICILTPAYFLSESCGKEFEVFLRRSEVAGREGIFPITWTPVKEMPSVISDVQMYLRDIPAAYVNEGMAYLMRLSRHRDEYQQLLKTFARELNQIASNHPLPELSEMPLENIPNAFALEEFVSGGGSVSPSSGPREVSFIFATYRDFGTPLQLIAFECARNLKLTSTVDYRSDPRSSDGKTIDEKGIVNEIRKTASTNTICVITIGPELVNLGELMLSGGLDAQHCALLVVSDKENLRLPILPNFGYVSPPIRSESAYRSNLELAIVRIRHSMISKSPATPVRPSGPHSPNLPSTT